MSPSQESRSFSRVLTAIGMALVIVAVVFTESITTSRVATNASELHWANATTGVGATARAAAVQAQMLLAGANLGLVEAETATSAIAEVHTQYESLRRWSALRPEAASAELTASLDTYVESMALLIASLDGRNLNSTSSLVSGALDEDWRNLELQLETAQNDAVERVAASEGLAGLMGLVTRVALTLVIPVGAVALYRYRARQQLREARTAFDTEMSTQQRIANEKNHLIAGVSHELKTPLTSIVGFSELLAAGDPALDVTESANVIRSEARNLRRLIDDFVAASRLTDGSVSPSPTSVPVGQMVGAEVAAIADSATVHLNLTQATVFADPNLVGQILRNLLWNAITHGGPTIWISGRISGTSYQLVVSDDGTGLKVDDVERLFQAFGHDGDNAVTAGSVGLGLFVSRGLARRLDGDIHYARSDGWTQFVLSLPLAAGHELAPELIGSRTAAA